MGMGYVIRQHPPASPHLILQWIFKGHKSFGGVMQNWSCLYSSRNGVCSDYGRKKLSHTSHFSTISANFWYNIWDFRGNTWNVLTKQTFMTYIVFYGRDRKVIENANHFNLCFSMNPRNITVTRDGFVPSFLSFQSIWVDPGRLHVLVPMHSRVVRIVRTKTFTWH